MERFCRSVVFMYFCNMINYDLKKIKAIVFDVDGVLSKQTVAMDNEGRPLRSVNIKDGYAIQLACKSDVLVAIITGGKSEAVSRRYSGLGVSEIYQGIPVKTTAYDELKAKYSLADDEIMYMGDDVPDYEVMRMCGCPCCPKDACSDIKDISIYVSDRNGGCGCARDVIEQVLRVQGKWLHGAKAFGW